nr:hypothetical protein [Bacilli bacterium]
MGAFFQARLRGLVPWLGVLFVVLAMLFIAMVFAAKVIIFPEIAALAVGSLVYNEERWVASRLFFWLLPSLSALLGVLIDYTNFPLFIKELVALFLVLLLLQGFRSQVAPSISAAILPIVLGVHSWFFVLSVTVLTITVTLLHKATKSVSSNKSMGLRDRKSLIAYSLIASLWIVVTYVLPFHLKVIPPLLVVFYEMIAKRDRPKKDFIERGVFLIVVAILGVLVASLLGQDLVLIGLVDVVLVALLAKKMALRLPPAFAIALLPIVFRGSGLSYIAVVMLTILFLFGLLQSVRALEKRWG